MTQLAEHPTVKRFYERAATEGQAGPPGTLDTAWPRGVCLDARAGWKSMTQMVPRITEPAMAA